jgi:hypothetical protein
MTEFDLLADAFGRVRHLVHAVVDGLEPAQLDLRVDDRANTIAWLVWHLTRVQDDHIADAADSEQVWTAQGWVERFGLPLDPSDTGFGHGPEQVARVHVDDSALLTGYHDDVHSRSLQYLSTLAPADLDRVIDQGWDPPVTLGVRLISVIGDDLQHAGQAAFVRGLLERRAASS